jgi:predicted AAA+ superfamily ATPase
MNTAPAVDSLAARLSERLHRSLEGELPPVGTPRSIRRGLSPPNKATPVIGVRRGGKTTYLRQLERLRRESRAAWKWLLGGGD